MEYNNKEVDIEDFIKRVNIAKDNQGSTCEYEVAKSAMEFYLTYPCYKRTCKLISYGDSIGSYVRTLDQRDEKKNATNLNYQGAYLLKEIEGEKVLTADILTSIRSPINIWLRKNGFNTIGKKYTGFQIRECILNDKFRELIGYKGENTSLNDTILFIKAFAYVYYWCGNMMPVIWNPSVGKSDTINYKVYKIKEFFGNGQEDSGDWETLKEQLKMRRGRNYVVLWKMWFNLCWNEKSVSNFLKDNYLIDISSQNRDSTTEEIDSNWFLKNTKLIIQRSYRVAMGVQGPFNKEQEMFIGEIFKNIFDKAQIPKEKRNLELV